MLKTRCKKWRTFRPGRLCLARQGTGAGVFLFFFRFCGEKGSWGVSENSPTLFYSTKKPHLLRCIRLHSTEECGAHAFCIWRFFAHFPAFLTSQIHPKP